MLDELILQEFSRNSDLHHRIAQHIFYITLYDASTIKRSEKVDRALRRFLNYLGAWYLRPLNFSLADRYERHIMMDGISWHLVNCRLSSSDEKKLETFISRERNQNVDPLLAIAGGGYKITITWVDNSNSFVVSASGPKENHINARKTLSSWSDDYVEALWMTYYKISVIYDNKVWTDKTAQNWG